MQVQRRWIFWQVAIPLLGPIAASLVFIGLWMSGDTFFKPSVAVIVDVSPWALIFFALTLLGATYNELEPKIANNLLLARFMLGAMVAVLLYAAFIVIWRHNASWRPGPRVWIVTTVLLVASVLLSHQGYAKSKEP